MPTDRSLDYVHPVSGFEKDVDGIGIAGLVKNDCPTKSVESDENCCHAILTPSAEENSRILSAGMERLVTATRCSARSHHMRPMSATGEALVHKQR